MNICGKIEIGHYTPHAYCVAALLHLMLLGPRTENICEQIKILCEKYCAHL